MHYPANIFSKNGQPTIEVLYPEQYNCTAANKADTD